jgi:acetoin utilization protein AcuC
MLLVYGPLSPTYDFGPWHPLTPRRFGPGIDLLRSVGAEPGLAPEPATDDELRWCHHDRYIGTVKRLGADPSGPPEAGIAAGGDVPPFGGMHEAGSMVAGGSLRAMEAVLRGDVEHAFHPGGGLHHAMPGRASGFCIYDDPALAIARARRDGLRVLYVDFDVHHGDGVQAIHWDDPGVMTLSFHETGRYLFPGSGDVGELGDGLAAGTAVNVSMEPGTGEVAWSSAVRTILPEVAAAFGPDVIVSQHGSDSHAWDPLAHQLVTTTAMGEAARLVDRLAHHHAGGRWLATGGGGYDAYRVVPRAWSLVWLAGAHRDVPGATSEAWRERWTGEAGSHGQVPLPVRFDDEPNAGLDVSDGQRQAETWTDETVGLVRRLAVPAIVRTARDRGWWDPMDDPGPSAAAATPTNATAAPRLLDPVDPATWSRLTVAEGVLAPVDRSAAHALVAAGLLDGLVVTAAVSGSIVVGAVVTDTRPASGASDAALIGLGVAPAWRRQGLAGRLLATHVAALGDRARGLTAEVTVAERDPVDPIDGLARRAIARRLLEAGGFTIVAADPSIHAADPAAVAAVFRTGGRP